MREQLAAERRVGTELAQLNEKQRWQYDQLNARFKFMRAAGEQDAGPEHPSPDATVVERRLSVADATISDENNILGDHAQ